MRPPHDLNPTSRTAAEIIRRLYPSWEDRSEVQWTTEEGWLEVRVPSPCAAERSDLILQVESEQITVIFHGPWHQHLDFDPESAEFPVQVAQLTRLLDGILSDRLVALNLFRGSDWAGSMTGEIGQDLKLRPGDHRDALDLGAKQGATALVVRSWSGAFDFDETLDACGKPPRSEERLGQ